MLWTGQRVAPESRWSRVTSLTSTRKTSIASQTSTISQTNTSRTSILTRTTTAASCPEAQLRIQVDQVLSLPLSASLLSSVFWSLFPSFHYISLHLTSPIQLLSIFQGCLFLFNTQWNVWFRSKSDHLIHIIYSKTTDSFLAMSSTTARLCRKSDSVALLLHQSQSRS